MLRSRAIPCLLLRDEGLVKTKRFGNERYIGDPINAIRIFNEKEVDELMLLDIDATKYDQGPNFSVIEQVASECFMPLCYGGGVTSLEQMRQIYRLGVEKISLCTSAASNPDLVRRASSDFGAQSVVVTIDVKRTIFGRYEVVTRNGTRKTKNNPVDFAKQMADCGAGELVIQSVDRDGMMGGYDLALFRSIKAAVPIPIIALGGAGSLGDIGSVVNDAGASAAAAGSLFVYYGPLQGILINYPTQEELTSVFGD